MGDKAPNRFFLVDVNMWWGDRPLKPSIPKLIPRQIGELHSELDLGLGVSCAGRGGVGDRAKHHCFSSSAYETGGKCEGLDMASFARCFSASEACGSAVYDGGGTGSESDCEDASVNGSQV